MRSICRSAPPGRPCGIHGPHFVGTISVNVLEMEARLACPRLGRLCPRLHQSVVELSSYCSFINRPLVSMTLFFAGKSTTARSAAVAGSRSSLILARNHIAAPPNRLIRMICGGDHKAVSSTLEPKGLLAANPSALEPKS
jgi:hypothetical protein